MGRVGWFCDRTACVSQAKKLVGWILLGFFPNQEKTNNVFAGKRAEIMPHNRVTRHLNRDVRLETFRITRDGRREDDIHRRRLRHRLTLVLRGEEKPRARARGGQATTRLQLSLIHI